MNEQQRAQDMTEAERAAAIEAMTAAIEADTERREQIAAERAERAKWHSLNIRLPDSTFNYCKAQASAAGISITRMAARILTRCAEAEQGKGDK